MAESLTRMRGKVSTFFLSVSTHSSFLCIDVIPDWIICETLKISMESFLLKKLSAKYFCFLNIDLFMPTFPFFALYDLLLALAHT